MANTPARDAKRLGGTAHLTAPAAIQRPIRAEIERLKRSNDRNDALLDALSSTKDPDAYKVILQGLMDSTITRQANFFELVKKKIGAPSHGSLW